MEITINIKSPELAEALNNIANVIAITVSGMDKGLEAEQHPMQQQYNTQHGQQNPTYTLQTAPVQQPDPIQNVSQQMYQQPQVQNIPVQNLQPQQQTVPVQQPQYTQPVQQQPATVPTQAQTYTMDQLAIAATQLMDAGKRNELIGLLGQFGVQALTALPKEQYGAFATALRGMGAKI